MATERIMGMHRLAIHPRYVRALAIRCAKPMGLLPCNPPAVQLLPGAVYCMDSVRMLKVPAEYDGPAVVMAPEVMTRLKSENTLEIEDMDWDVYLNAVKTAVSFQRRDEVDDAVRGFNCVASLRVSAKILRDAFKALKRCRVVGISAQGNSTIVFATNSRERCIDVRKVPAKAEGPPSHVYLYRRFLKEALGLPGDEVTIEFQEDEWWPIKVRRLGDTIEYIAPWQMRSDAAVIEAWEHVKEAS